MTQQPLFINWLTNQPIAKDYVSVMDPAFGARADGVTDDSTAIQAAINALPKGGTVLFPQGIYAVGGATAITLPTAIGITLQGMGRAEGGGSVLKATASITSMIGTGTTFIRGHRITDLQIDGNNKAQYCLKMDQIDASVFDNLFLYNATTLNFRLGDGTHSTQENVIFAVRIDNPLITVLANLPTYNLEINGTNNDIICVKCANAKTANLHSSTAASGNKYVNVHGYDFFNGAAQPVTNNILVDGSQEQFVNFECDGSGSVNIQVNGFGNSFVGGFSQFQGLAAQIGVQFANATSGNIVLGCAFANSTAANTIVQAGSPAAPGNFYFLNYNETQGTLASNSALVSTPGGGVGYATGAGGTVTQLTNKGTGVTLNTITGQITMNNAALAGGATVSFTLTNSAVGAADAIIINHISAGTAGAYALTAQAFSGGIFIVVRNVTGGSLSEAIVLSYAVIKAVTS